MNRASYNHGLFCDGSAEVYYKIEEATPGTQFAHNIKSFQKSKNGRDAYVVILHEADKWEAQLKKLPNRLHTRKCKGQGNYSLERLC